MKIILNEIILNMYKEQINEDINKQEKEISSTEDALNDGYVDYNDRIDFRNEITGRKMIIGNLETKISKIDKALMSKDESKKSLEGYKVSISLDRSEIIELKEIIEERKFIIENDPVFVYDIKNIELSQRRVFRDRLTEYKILLAIFNDALDTIEDSLVMEKEQKYKVLAIENVK